MFLSKGNDRPVRQWKLLAGRSFSEAWAGGRDGNPRQSSIFLRERDRAIDLIEPLLRVPYYMSSIWLSIDANFAPLKGYPRFEKLLHAKR